MAESLRTDAYQDEQEADFQASTLKRSTEQEKARVQRARAARQQGNSLGAFSDLGERSEYSQEGALSSTPDQKKVQRLRMWRQEKNSTPFVSEKKGINYIAYTPAFAIAILKDLLDLVGIGSLPVIGWVVTTMAAILIFIALSFTDTTMSRNASKRMLVRIGGLAGTVVVEGFATGINLLPLETAAVALILFFDMKDTVLPYAQKILKYTPVGRASKVVLK